MSSSFFPGVDLSRLTCDTIENQPVPQDWLAVLDPCEERGRIVYPDVSDWGVEECREYLDDYGREFEDDGENNPFAMDASEIAELMIEDGLLAQGDADAMSEDGLRKAMIEALDDGSMYGVEDWREAVQEAMQESDEFEPVMTYAWPVTLDGDEAEAASRLVGLPLSLVNVDNEHYLALTGGGMDMSWEIAEAYIRLGCYPPFAVRLPRMAGRGYSALDLSIIDACERSARVLRAWTGYRLDDYARLRGSSAERVTVTFTGEDLPEDWTADARDRFLAEHGGSIRDRMVERGNDMISNLVEMFGDDYAPAEEED